MEPRGSCVYTQKEETNKQKNTLGQCVSEFLSPCISLGILKHKRGRGHHHAFQVLAFWDCEAQREGRDPRGGRGPTLFPGRARGQSSGLKSGGQGLPQEPQKSMWGPEGKGGRSDSERLTVIGHNRVPLVMFLSRPQMMLYALKLRG